MIEASALLRVRWPRGEIRLEPGKPVSFPREQARKLLQKLPDKVRFIPPQPHWLLRWRELASLTDGLLRTDCRYQPVLAALDRCDVAFEHGDWPAFQEAAEAVKRLVQGA